MMCQVSGLLVILIYRSLYFYFFNMPRPPGALICWTLRVCEAGRGIFFILSWMEGVYKNPKGWIDGALKMRHQTRGASKLSHEWKRVLKFSALLAISGLNEHGITNDIQGWWKMLLINIPCNFPHSQSWILLEFQSLEVRLFSDWFGYW